MWYAPAVALLTLILVSSSTGAENRYSHVMPHLIHNDQGQILLREGAILCPEQKHVYRLHRRAKTRGATAFLEDAAIVLSDKGCRFNEEEDWMTVGSKLREYESVPMLCVVPRGGDKCYWAYLFLFHFKTPQ